jgi:anti-sigma B factor antagonist
MERDQLMTETLTHENNKLPGEGLPLSVSSWREGNALFLALRGEVDMYTVGELQDAIRDGLKDGICTEVVADMSNAPFVDSIGYGAFLSAMQTLRLRNGGRVHLACCQPAVARMITVARLQKVFAIHDSLEQARAAVSGRSASS